jgi:hypothetical protein
MASTNSTSRPIVKFPAYFLGRPASRYLDRYATRPAATPTRRARVHRPSSRRTSGVVTAHDA